MVPCVQLEVEKDDMGAQINLCFLEGYLPKIIYTKPWHTRGPIISKNDILVFVDGLFELSIELGETYNLGKHKPSIIFIPEDLTYTYRGMGNSTAWVLHFNSGADK